MRKFIAIILILSAICLLLGCTPEKEETMPTVTSPDLTVPNRTDPAVQTESDPLQTTPDTTGEAVKPPEETDRPVNTEEPTPVTEPGKGEEEEDTDVEDTYNIIVSDNIGVGGN